MPLLDQIRAKKLIELAHERFDSDLLYAEVKVLRDSACPVDSPYPHKLSPRPAVRAGFLRWLATDHEARPYIDTRGLRVNGATVVGSLDLGLCQNIPTLRLIRCTFSEEVNLKYAEVRGIYFLDCSTAKGMQAQRVVVRGMLFLLRLQASGEICLRGSEIEGDLVCSGAKVDTEGIGLSIDGASIGGNIRLDDEFECSGDVLLTRTRIKGVLDCSGAKLTSPGDSLVMYGVNVGGDIFLNNVECSGAISLIGAKIKGQLVCSGAKLTALGSTFYLDLACVGGSVFLDRNFDCSGPIHLAGTEIRGVLSFVGAKIGVVCCNNLRLADDLLWQGICKRSETSLDLTGAQVKNLRDDRESWPNQHRLILDGLIYDELTLHRVPQELIAEGEFGYELPLSVTERIAWLMLQPLDRRKEPQPWMQLARHLELKSERAGAKHVLYKLRCLQAQENSFPSRRIKIAFAWLEEAPRRIVYSIFLTLLLGTLIFAGASPGRSGAMIPTAKDNTGQPLFGNALVHYPQFQPFVYTLENALPLVKLGMDDKWAPDPNRGGQAWFPKYRRLDWLAWFNSYWFLTVSRWLLILSGWFQATVLAAALANRFKP